MILVDTSVWIDYFRGGEHSEDLSDLIQLDVVCTNEIILTELLPVLVHRNQKDLTEALQALPCVPYTVFWAGIRLVQNLNIKSGINKVGLPDLMIAQHCIDCNLELWSLDKHFQMMSKHIALKLFKS